MSRHSPSPTTLRGRVAALRARSAASRGRSELARRIATAGPGERDELAALQRRG